MSEQDSPSPSAAPRRSFLTALGAIVVGGLAGLAPVAASVVSVFDPLRKRGSDTGMVRVTTLAVLPPDGSPRKFTINADQTDAWTTHRDAPIGSVYLRAVDGDVRALNVVCPHAGCFVGVADDGSRFACPCHKSSFDLDGVINDPASPSPRDMDVLEAELRNGDEVWVRFQNFQPGHSDKNPVA